MEEGITIQTAKKEKLRERIKDFLKDIDEDLRYFCKEVRKDLRDEKDHVIAITGYPGMGKSQLATILGLLIDFEYEFNINICFIPTSKDIENLYLSLPLFSILHIDEASRGLHKQKWYEKIQQTLNTLYDTEREDHYICTLLLMPRFQNFTENFRNFRIKYWINILDRGIAIIYKRDDDKDSKDPWHIDENYKLKTKTWKGKKVYDRDIESVIKIEQRTINYWFWFKIPEIPKEIWGEYQVLKKQSRIEKKEIDFSVESYKDRLDNEKLERWKRIKELEGQGIKTAIEQSIYLKCSESTIKRVWREMRTLEKMKGNNEVPIEPKVIKKSKEELMKEFELT